MAEAASLRLELFVRDVAASVAFYRDVLGFATESEQPGYVSVFLGSVVIGICAQSDLPHGHHFNRSPGAPNGVGVEIVIEVDDVMALHDRVTAAGYRVTTRLGRRAWGATDFRVVDPDGYFLRPTSRGQLEP